MTNDLKFSEGENVTIKLPSGLGSKTPTHRVLGWDDEGYVRIFPLHPWRPGCPMTESRIRPERLVRV